MPFTRPRTKSQPYSPAVSSIPFQPAGSSAPKFFPPSHYAVAGGLPLSPRSHTTPADDMEAPSTLRSPYNSLPPSTLPMLHTSPSVSSTEQPASSRFSTLTRRLSRNGSTSSRSGVSQRRSQSQLGDLPAVETQLLPSLRDTIDKMTNPSRSSFVNEPSDDGRLLPTPLASHTSSTPGTSSSRVRKPKVTANRFEYNVPAKVEVSRIPAPPFKSPKPNAPLKSALKASAPSATAHGSDALPGSPKSSPNKGSPSKSLMSMKNLIGKKSWLGSSGASSSTSPSKGQDRRAHERSRTDPGSSSRIPARVPNVSKTPQPPSSTYGTPKRTTRTNKGLGITRAPSNSSASEFELHSERRRALIVTNAEIVPSSSSESSAASEPGEPSIPQVIPRPMSRQKTVPYENSYSMRNEARTAGNVGLGFDVMASVHATRYSNGHGYGHDAGNDVDSIYEPDDDRAPSPVSVPAQRSTTYPDVDDHRFPRYSENATGADTQRRMEALTGIVNALADGQLAVSSRGMDDSFESEYGGQPGLAISPSTNFEAEGLTGGLSESGSHPLSLQPGGTPQESSGLLSLPPSRSYTYERQEDPPRRKPPEIDPSPRRALRFQLNEEDTAPSESEYTSDEGGNGEGEFSDTQTPRVSSMGTSQRFVASRPMRSSTAMQSIPESRNPTHPLSRRFLSDRPVPIMSHTTPELGFTSADDRPFNNKHASPLRSTARSPTRPLRYPARPSPLLSRGAEPRKDRHSRHLSTKDKFTSETYSLQANLGLAEAQEREAFGIPPSPELQLRSVESASSIGSGRWQDEGDGLSRGAETIFKQLSKGDRMEGASPTQHWKATDETHSRQNGTSVRSSNSTNLHPSASGRSIYEAGVPQRPWQEREPGPAPALPDPDAKTWRATLPSSAYRSLLDRYGEKEMQRQEIIWDLCDTEQTFVKRMRTMVRLFIQPLRAKDTQTWLMGVPVVVARLFDWLEDIVNLHSQIASALHAAISAQYPVVMRIAEVVRTFVPRLEVHQPYLVRVEEVVLAVKDMIHEGSDDFGEFIHMQEQTEECKGWTLEAFLAEPVNRLVDYPMCFRRLWDLTPRDHVDHLATFSLLHSTETMIRIMREVKVREEEHDLVTDLLRRIQGLPKALELARRERRLLARGRLIRQYANEARPGISDLLSRNAARESFASNRPMERTKDRQSRLFNAVQSRNASAASRSDSVRSTTTASSMESHTTSPSTTPPITPVSAQHDEGYFMTTPRLQDDRYTTGRRDSLFSLRVQGTPKQTTVNALVFTDLVLLVSSVRDDAWRLVDDIGISRILGVTEDRAGGSISLDLLPIDPDDLSTGAIPDSAPVTSVMLTIPPTNSSGMHLEPSTISGIRMKWASAFQRCSQHTLRALSFPFQSGKYLSRGPGADLALDSRQSVMAILGSGLPLPKSPSTQLGDVIRGRGGDSVQQEREERGWWALQFQRVLHDMQRGDCYVPSLPRLVLGPSISASDVVRKRPGVSRPRPLKLATLSSSESLALKDPT